MQHPARFLRVPLAAIARERLLTSLLAASLGLTACSTDAVGPADSQVEATASLSTASSSVHYVPSSIDPTGRTDVTNALNAYFASVPDSSRIVFPPNSRYRIEGTLRLVGRHSLELDGNGSTFFATTDGSGATAPADLARLWPRNRAHWSFVGGSNIFVRRLTVDGANANAGLGDYAYVERLEAQHAFNVQGVKRFLLQDVTATDVYGDFVYLGRSGAEWTTDVKIYGNRFERNGRQGIAIVAASGVQIVDNYIGQIRRGSIDIEPNTVADGAVDIRIRENTFGPGRLMFLASGGGPGLVRNVLIEHNRLVGKPMTVIVKTPDGTRRTGIKIVNNISDQEFGSSGPLMQFTRVDGLIVRGNQNPLTAGRLMTGVRATESCRVDVAENEFIGAIQELSIVSPSC